MAVGWCPSAPGEAAALSSTKGDALSPPLYIYIRMYMYVVPQLQKGLILLSRNTLCPGRGLQSLDLKWRNIRFTPRTDGKTLRETQPEVGRGKERERGAFWSRWIC